MIIDPKMVVTDPEAKTVEVTVHCHFCSASAVVKMTVEEYQKRYVDGEMIQNALPNHSKTDREVLTSGLCHKCQEEEEVFGSE